MHTVKSDYLQRNRAGIRFFHHSFPCAPAEPEVCLHPWFRTAAHFLQFPDGHDSSETGLSPDNSLQEPALFHPAGRRRSPSESPAYHLKCHRLWLRTSAHSASHSLFPYERSVSREPVILTRCSSDTPYPASESRSSSLQDPYVR